MPRKGGAPGARRRVDGALAALVAHTPLVLGTAALGLFVSRAVLDRAGGPAVPLDDSYIHFQYARSLAELHPFRYTPGAAPTPGATSLLWPLVLAPFYALGLRGAALVFAGWTLGWVSLALLALETKRLADGLVRPAVAVAAGAMVVAFGGFAWFAASGMEVVPFAWLLTRAARRAAEWVDGGSSANGVSPPSRRELVLLAALCPLMRPEGAVASVAIAVVLALFPRGASRLLSGAALAGPLLPPVLCFLATGQAVASTALAKWLPLNPYFHGAHLVRAVLANVGVFFETLLDGRLWTSVFLPAGGRTVAVLALPAVVIAGVRRSLVPRALLVLGLGLAILIPTTYETFLVNRVRYIWPFAAAWMVGLAALADVVGDTLEHLLRRFGVSVSGIPVLLAGTLVGLFASQLPGSIDDLAESAHAVTSQQVAMARWAKAALPADARLGVNDTGATAYFGGHPTFDVVGLTTAGEARYWIAGPGSRFEHYEKLPLSALPTHFMVYPEWFALDTLLGEEITSRSVRHTILGGVTMAAYPARYDALGSGDLPSEWSTTGRKLVDSLDVADLESEAVHRYALLDATQARDTVVEQLDHVDGARTERSRDEFEMKLVAGGTLLARLGARSPVRLRIGAGGRTLSTRDLDADAWQEIVIPIPREFTGGTTTVVVAVVDEATAISGTFDSLHYWSYE
jgi:hypothetical protein